jgi:hypothetical protein
MPTRTELMTALSRADTAWSSVRGVGPHWRRHDLTTTAFHRYTRTLLDGGQALSTFVTVAGDTPDDDLVRESILTLATDRHGTRRRAEALSRRGEQWQPDTLVIDGDRFWARTGTTVMTNQGDPRSQHGGAGIVRLLLPSSVPAGFDLAPTGETEQVAGRTCAIASAAPREPDPSGRTPGSEVFNMIAGGVDFRLSIDLGTGTLVKVVKFVDGEIAEVCEFTEITLDEALSDDLFAPLV